MQKPHLYQICGLWFLNYCVDDPRAVPAKRWQYQQNSKVKMIRIPKTGQTFKTPWSSK